MEAITTEIYEEEDRVIIEQNNDEVWILYDEYFDQWLVTNRSRSTSEVYYDDRDSAVVSALTEIGVL